MSDFLSNNGQPSLLCNPNDQYLYKHSQGCPDLQRFFSRLELEPIYLLKLTVKVGVQSLKLDGSHLGISEANLARNS